MEHVLTCCSSPITPSLSPGQLTPPISSGLYISVLPDAPLTCDTLTPDQWSHARMVPLAAIITPRHHATIFSHLIFKSPPEPCAQSRWDGNLAGMDIMFASLFRLCPGSGRTAAITVRAGFLSRHLTPSRLNSPSSRGWAILNKSNGHRLCDDAWARGKTR